ncbi:hypothetical protein PIB30_079045 [Stylosanthes scabra]|uniref:Uncharacterized protein n=1 Tax=Stylosanthes scabra TaxID=79078 RepID=A0ABU6SR85_9FABA|nr:hypothetical protein [Stylosanthes scabra]
MARLRSNPLAKGKTKAHKLPLRASPRLAALRSLGTMQPELQAPDIPIENIPMPILLPKKRLTYQMVGEGSSRKGTNPLCRRSQRIAELHRAKNQASEEHEVIALSSDSEHEKDGNLEVDAEGALPAAKEGAEETLLKNDVYAVLWAMLDAESENEAEEISGQWDLDNVLNNWGKIKPDVGPADQGPPPAVHTTILIGEMKGKSRKAGIGWEPRAFPTRYTRVNERKHDRAKFGAEVAKESVRNENIANKSLKAKSRAYAYAPKKPMRMHCHDLGITS